jgi:SAM-dependent methyltransferase
VLDIGCGRGVMLAALKRAGWTTVGTQLSEAAAERARQSGVTVHLADIREIPRDSRFGVISLFHVIEHVQDLKESIDRIVELLLPGGYLILEYPNGNSLLKSLSGQRWFAYDPPNHRFTINPVVMADSFGLLNCRLIQESHHSWEYSFFVFAQTLANILLPNQRDLLYKALLDRSRLDAWQKLGALLTLPIFAVALILFPLFQIAAGACGRGCIVRQVFKKSDIA